MECAGAREACDPGYARMSARGSAPRQCQLQRDRTQLCTQERLQRSHLSRERSCAFVGTWQPHVIFDARARCEGTPGCNDTYSWFSECPRLDFDALMPATSTPAPASCVHRYGGDGSLPLPLPLPVPLLLPFIPDHRILDI
jgi:hypothetical protein